MGSGLDEIKRYVQNKKEIDKDLLLIYFLKQAEERGEIIYDFGDCEYSIPSTEPLKQVAFHNVLEKDQRIKHRRFDNSYSPGKVVSINDNGDLEVLLDSWRYPIKSHISHNWEIIL